jgi:hypothetical protein
VGVINDTNRISDYSFPVLMFIMLLYWMTYESPEGTVVFIQPAYELGMARLRASLAGAPEEFKEALQLGAKTSKKVPQDMIGRLLSAKEGQAQEIRPFLRADSDGLCLASPALKWLRERRPP